MESATHRLAEQAKTQAELRRQIASLQAQLVDNPQVASVVHATPISPKRKHVEGTQLAPPTPSPKKRKAERRLDKPGPTRIHSSHVASTSSRLLQRKSQTTAEDLCAVPQLYSKPAASNVLSKLATINRRSGSPEPSEAVVRSSAFTERPRTPPAANNGDGDTFSSKRNDRLELVEDLEVGPFDHTPPFDDPRFEYLEPNSGIRLKSRSMPHEDLQDHLRGRYYLSPSRLYSVIRLLPDKQGYDVPVAGDFVTIAVVAERGDIKFSRAPVTVSTDGDGTGEPKWKGKAKEEPQKPSGKRYVNMRLIDFGARSRSASSATGGKAVIRGDAFLSLLLFESDGFDLVTADEGGKPERVYKGGSRGAFEKFSRLKEGDVIALLNPKILKPFQRSSDSPHPVNNILAISPESAGSIEIIGRARDLGLCQVVKKDGNKCGSWCDKRISEVCEWHVQNAVERRRAGRAEFSIGTSGMGKSTAPKKKPAYDPARQWGLKPEHESGGATYVVSGHVVGESGADPRMLSISENMGREGQAKAKRKSVKDADRALKSLLDRDKDGMKAVMKAREAGKMLHSADAKSKDSNQQQGKKVETRNGKRKAMSSDEEDDTTTGATKSYSAEVIKQLGFDPIAKAGHRRMGDTVVQNKLEALAAVQTSRKRIALGPRPGERIRSGVVAPAEKPRIAKPVELRDLDDSEDDLPERVTARKSTEPMLVDLDSDD